MARIVIVHRWQGKPEADWYPWLQKQLESKGHQVLVPAMPDPEHPNIYSWLAQLAKSVGRVDEKTFFVGHSIGCQTVLRYLAHSPNQGVAGGVVLVAPWEKLKPESYEDPEDYAVARPWLEMPIPWELARTHAKHFFCLFSDHDPYVALDEEKTFKQKLGAETLVEKGKGHYTQYDGVKELLIVLEKLNGMMK